MKPLVSILVPHFNDWDYLALAIQSVQNQDYPNWEVIVVDDHSTNQNTEVLAMLNSDSRIRFMRNDSGKKGAAASRNWGIRQARGQYVLFLDADDLLEKHCLQARVQKIEATGADIVLGNMFFLDEGATHPFFHGEVSLEKAKALFLLGIPPFTVTTPLWRKKTFESLGGFNVDFIAMEDPDLHLRALLDPNIQWDFNQPKVPDCWYRINHKTNEKQVQTIRNSISGKNAFYAFWSHAEVAQSYRKEMQWGLRVFYIAFLCGKQAKTEQIHTFFATYLHM